MAETIERMSATVTRHLTAINSKMDVLSHRVDTLDQTSETPQGSEDHLTPPTSTPWADRDPSERPAYDDVILWPEEGDSELLGDTEESDGAELRPVSEKTATFLKENFSKSVPNSSRRRWRHTYGMPQCEATKCPKFDTTVKAQVSKTVKDSDRPLAYACRH